MAHTEERKNGVLDILYSKAGGNASKCARLTGVDRKTILRWQKEHESCGTEDDFPEGIPDAEVIKEKIIRRVFQIIERCNDPKKLMDTYEAVSKFQKESGQTKTSLFEMIEERLNGK